MMVVAAHPLDVRDAGFLLTFGATAALLEIARRLEAPARLPSTLRWIVAGMSASLAAEIALMPVAATAFSRITGAGIVLNLIAVPVMGVTQVAGMIVVLFDRLQWVAWPAGWAAHAGAVLLVESAHLVEFAPWIARRVPAPAAALTAAYYVALGLALFRRGITRKAGLALWCAAACAIVFGLWPANVGAAPPPGVLRLTMFDVGQGDALLLQTPEGHSIGIDTGGAPFGGGGFDIGGRVLIPAMWARAVRRLNALLITHGDPDHVGGAAPVVDGLSPREVWEGIPVPGNLLLDGLEQHAAARGARLRFLHGPTSLADSPVRIRVLSPPLPDWERRKVRNDDSVVLEAVYGDVALLLTGDIGAGVEASILPQLAPARIRILKVAHHGSRTSSSPVLLEGWRPQIALISAGRGNRFGHPVPEIVARLESVGARVYRTDRDGEITVTTDGRSVHVDTFMER
jgi:competence protein ComEC